MQRQRKILQSPGMNIQSYLGDKKSQKLEQKKQGKPLALKASAGVLLKQYRNERCQPVLVGY